MLKTSKPIFSSLSTVTLNLPNTGLLHAVVTPNHKSIPLLLQNDFTTVINHNANILFAGYLICGSPSGVTTHRLQTSVRICCLSLALLLHATAEFPPPSCPAQLFLLIVCFLSCPSPGAQDITLMDFYHIEDHQEREARSAEHTIMEANGNALDTHRAHPSPG